LGILVYGLEALMLGLGKAVNERKFVFWAHLHPFTGLSSLLVITV
jgi:hypothetical protein